MVVLRHSGFKLESGCILAKVFVFGQERLHKDKVVVFEQKWLYSGTNGCNRGQVNVFGKSCCFRAKVVVFGQRWLYSGKRDCIRATLFSSGKMVVIGQKL